MTRPVEKAVPVDQRLAAAVRLIAARRDLFAHQGAVVETYRRRRDGRRGPYYSLRYREAGRQCSLYLGASAATAVDIRRQLAELQSPRIAHKQHVQLKRLQRCLPRPQTRVVSRPGRHRPHAPRQRNPPLAARCSGLPAKDAKCRESGSATNPSFQQPHSSQIHQRPCSVSPQHPHSALFSRPFAGNLPCPAQIASTRSG